MSKLELVNASCIDQEADAIVNAANGYMMHGGGVARAILLKAGPELNDACKQYNLPIKDGEVIVTPAFNIRNAKIIIHAVGPNFGNTPNAFDKLLDAYYNALVALKENGYHSISFPLISSGIFGGDLENPVKESTKECIEAYRKFNGDYPDYDVDIRLCAFSPQEFKDATEVMNESDINNSKRK